MSKLKAISKGVKPVNEKINNLRDESLLTSVKSPSTPTETSSSEEDSSSEEESEYDEDEDMPVMDISEVSIELVFNYPAPILLNTNIKGRSIIGQLCCILSMRKMLI